jgi:hypothetical protein
MSDAAIFVSFFGGILIVRLIAATVVFVCLTPRTDRCPHCNTPTLRVVSPWWNRLMPWFRTSWCYACGWEGMLRPGFTPSEVTGGYSKPSRRSKLAR